MAQKHTPNTYFIVIAFLCLGLTNGFAQENFNALFQPTIKLGYNLSEKYSIAFGVENRNRIYKNSEFEYQVKHIEFSHLSKYKLDRKMALGVGIVYRFQDNFESPKENELRLQQQFELITGRPSLGLKHRFRTEQRIYPSTTKHRFRYRLGTVFDLGKSFGKETFFSTNAEAILEIASTQKPEFEQRLSTVFGWKLAPKMAFDIGLQYRLGDYTQNLNHELFFVTELEIRL